MVRVRADLAEVIRWLCKVKKTDSALLIDGYLREPLWRVWAENYELVKQLKELEDQSKRLLGEPPSPPLPSPVSDAEEQYAEYLQEERDAAEDDNGEQIVPRKKPKKK